jgi:hypothetical protein
MMSFLDPVARIEREHAANLAREDDFKSKIEGLKAEQQKDADFDTLNAIDEQIVTLERKLKLAEGVTANSAERLAAAKAEAAEKAGDDEHKADTRQSEKDVKIVRELDALVRQVAAKRDELAASIARTAAANDRRGARPFVLDAERRVRERLGRTIAAEFVERDVWRDGAGREPMQFRQDATGNLVPIEAGFTKVREHVQVRPERHEPASMPTRYVDALRLVDLEGRPL